MTDKTIEEARRLLGDAITDRYDSQCYAKGIWDDRPVMQVLTIVIRERDEALEVARTGVDLIKGDLVGTDWKRACSAFLVKAAPLLAKHGKETI